MRTFKVNRSKLSIAATLVFLFLPSTFANAPNRTTQDPVGAVFGLTSASPLPSPTGALNHDDTNTFLRESWKVGGNTPESVDFTWDPAGFDNTVLRITYAGGTWDNGGANFLVPFDMSVLESPPKAMLLYYELFFSENFQFVKGGKLPGLLGGPEPGACSGGGKPQGDDCFSSRLMWRTDGAGEVYSYLPSQESLCSQTGIDCNDDFGTSIGRGQFNFTTGKWQTVAVFVQMNDPPTEANGIVALYYDNKLILARTDLIYRTSEEVTPTGMFFSTFFGGGDSSWATPQTVASYYRNMRMWAGPGLSLDGTTNNGNNDTGNNNNDNNNNDNNDDNDDWDDDDDDLEDC